jgi:hypothetical protein
MEISLSAIKLERGTVATPFVAPSQDYESRIEQNASEISMAVKVDGVTRAGMSLDADEGITLEADKVQILNNGVQSALFSNGILNAALIQVAQLMAINESGQRTITISECNDAFIRFYHPGGQVVAIKLGLDSVTVNNQTVTPIADSETSTSSKTASATSTLTPDFESAKSCFLQIFDEDGQLTYVHYLDGTSETPSNPTYWWKSYNLVPSGTKGIGLDQRLQATEYYEFHVKSSATVAKVYSSQNGKTFTRRMTDAEFEAEYEENQKDSYNYRIDDGKYYLPYTEDVLVTSDSESTNTRVRRYYIAKSGVLTYNKSYYDKVV